VIPNNPKPPARQRGDLDEFVSEKMWYPARDVSAVLESFKDRAAARKQDLDQSPEWPRLFECAAAVRQQNVDFLGNSPWQPPQTADEAKALFDSACDDMQRMVGSSGSGAVYDRYHSTVGDWIRLEKVLLRRLFNERFDRLNAASPYKVLSNSGLDNVNEGFVGFLRVFGKREPHPERKKHVRLIFATNIVDQLVMRVMFGWYSFASVDTWDSSGFGPGLGFNDEKLEQLLALLRRFRRPCGVDASAWDWHVTWYLMMAFVVTLGGIGSDWWFSMACKLTFLQFNPVCVLPNGEVVCFDVPGLMPSGWYLTGHANTRMACVAAKYATDPDELAAAMGDDTNLEGDGYEPANIMSRYLELNQELHQMETPEGRVIEFCSHRFDLDKGTIQFLGHSKTITKFQFTDSASVDDLALALRLSPVAHAVLDAVGYADDSPLRAYVTESARRWGAQTDQTGSSFAFPTRLRYRSLEFGGPSTANNLASNLFSTATSPLLRTGFSFNTPTELISGVLMPPPHEKSGEKKKVKSLEHVVQQLQSKAKKHTKANKKPGVSKRGYSSRNEYLTTLLNPEDTPGVRIPDDFTFPSAVFQTRLEFGLVTDANGNAYRAAGLGVGPGTSGMMKIGIDANGALGMMTSTTVSGGMPSGYIAAALTANGILTAADVTQIQANFSSIRPVSAQLSFIPTSAITTATGLVSAGCFSRDQFPAAVDPVGATTPGFTAAYGAGSSGRGGNGFTTLQQFNGSPSVRSVRSTEALTVLWKPQDGRDFQYRPVSTGSDNNCQFFAEQFGNATGSTWDSYLIPMQAAAVAQSNSALTAPQNVLLSATQSQAYPWMGLVLSGCPATTQMGQVVIVVNWEALPISALSLVAALAPSPNNPLELAQAMNVVEHTPEVIKPQEPSDPATRAINLASRGASHLYDGTDAKKAVSGQSVFSMIKDVASSLPWGAIAGGVAALL